MMAAPVALPPAGPAPPTALSLSLFPCALLPPLPAWKGGRHSLSSELLPHPTPPSTHYSPPLGLGLLCVDTAAAHFIHHMYQIERVCTVIYSRLFVRVQGARQGRGRGRELGGRERAGGSSEGEEAKELCWAMSGKKTGVTPQLLQRG